MAEECTYYRSASPASAFRLMCVRGEPQWSPWYLDGLCIWSTCISPARYTQTPLPDHVVQFQRAAGHRDNCDDRGVE